jgi:hypothetical protein
MTLREEILAEIKKCRKDYGTRWYIFFNNFSLLTAGCPVRQDEFVNSSKYLDEMFNSGSDLIRTKTHRQFRDDIDNAFRESGTYEQMMNKSRLYLTVMEKLDSLHRTPEQREEYERTEGELAETFIEPYIRLRERGYTDEDLIG